MKLILQICFFIILLGCGSSKNASFQTMQGGTMGTSYSIVLETDAPLGQHRVDSVLEWFNDIFSTYEENSLLSLINREDGTIYDLSSVSAEKKKLFISILDLSQEIYRDSDGYFDPSVYPLIQYWGFGPAERGFKEAPDPAIIDSLKELVGYDKFTWTDSTLIKPSGGQLDFSAIAKGLGVDIVGQYLEKLGKTNYLVEIGGETKAKGPGRTGKGWRIGISRPIDNVRTDELVMKLNLADNSIATSGNYQNFYEENSVRYVHILNPKTGYAEPSELLSASVISDDCATADAWATAFMCMGLDRAKTIDEKSSDINATMIYDNEQGDLQFYIAPEIEKMITY